MSYHQHLRDDQWDRIKDGFPGSKEYRGRSSTDIGALLRALSGLAETVVDGVVYRKPMAIGTALIAVSAVGLSEVFGR